jgi:hypothetical protein
MNAKARATRSDIAKLDAVELAGRIRAAVDRGADVAEKVHKRALRLPLAPFEGVEPLEGVVRDLHRVSDRSISAIYDFVRDVNHGVARLATDWLAPPPPRSKPRPRRKPAARGSAASEAA